MRRALLILLILCQTGHPATPVLEVPRAATRSPPPPAPTHPAISTRWCRRSRGPLRSPTSPTTTRTRPASGASRSTTARITTSTILSNFQDLSLSLLKLKLQKPVKLFRKTVYLIISANSHSGEIDWSQRIFLCRFLRLEKPLCALSTFCSPREC